MSRTLEACIAAGLVATLALDWMLDLKFESWSSEVLEWLTIVAIGTASVTVFCAAWLLVAAMRR
ncbi:MAG: hypothetical protein M0Z47_10925 [Actinomycetota bacterium]|nr:hypothetical protein [Actinomycetota bacterium]